MCLKPVNFGSVESAVTETNCRDTFPLPPPAGTVPSAQSRALPDRWSCGDRLDVAYGADEFKIHLVTLA